jgi:hypothetical protein
MNQLVPPRFFFRWSLPVKRLTHELYRNGRLLGLSGEYRIPSTTEIDGLAAFAEIRIAWSVDGLGFTVEVKGKSRPPGHQSDRLMISDGLHVWIDTRSTQSVHRATKYCHQFAFLPRGGEQGGQAPCVQATPLARAREEAVLPDVSLVDIQSGVLDGGYWMDVWLPKMALTGFDPLQHTNVGFNYCVHDAEHGTQSLFGDKDFPYESNPSLWQVLDLRGGL